MISAIVDPRPLDYRSNLLCRAALGTSVRAELGNADGEVVRITTERGRQALCRVADETTAHGRSLRIDRFTRQALKAFPHEQIALEVVEPGSATELGLIPGVDLSAHGDSNIVSALKRELVEQRIAVRSGMMLYVPTSDALAGINFHVHFVQGDEHNEGVVTDQTTIWLIDQDHHHHGDSDHDHDHDAAAETVIDTTFEDVGGLDQQIREVREFVELPLVFPQVYRQLGIDPPRGVIFYGAPGTGKTLLARSVANEINAQLFYINGPEIVGTFSGETEANLRKVFAEASLNPPSIIFIDELDAIAPFRRMASTQSDARSVTQLLALLDGLTRVEGVIVIGTTNRIDTIDPALRRAGRFDREVYFPTPSTAAREQILRVKTREMPLSDDAIDSLPDVARRAYGYVGADLMELGREAGLNALRRAASRFVEAPSVASYPEPDELVVTSGDFQHALEQVRPSAMRESLLAYPEMTWDDIGGLHRVKQRLRELVETPLQHPELFAEAGLSANVGVVLHGPPGTGKTMLAQAIARESGANFIPIQGPELFSQWLGESEESVRHVFGVARRAAPSVIFIDQLDAVLPMRSDLEHEGTRAPQRVVNQVLAELDGMEDREQVIVIGATNRLSQVDPAALRPGRFGVHLRVDPPDAQDRAEILARHLAKADVDHPRGVAAVVDELVARTDGLVGADLAFLCQNATLLALQEAGFQRNTPVKLTHFAQALEELRSP
ncbi:AAA family ATPase [Egicoccus halophilus]|uniref:ATPase n=1 Tax=Egicoccus halophilus TaxID=1670830 RepID=A0A8J3AA69_9ACTN|nr:AAA family ATPase [Egicoccus halophilus]GGI02460.1 ATPase [Egicoccus halophilus]